MRGLTLVSDEPGFWESVGYHDYRDPWREQRSGAIGPRGRLRWRGATVREVVPSPSARARCVLDVPDWPGHHAGRRVDVRLTAKDGYQARRLDLDQHMAPERDTLELTVELVDDGEVSAYLVEDLLPGDDFELRGPMSGQASRGRSPTAARCCCSPAARGWSR